MSEEDPTKLLVRVDIPDVKAQKCVVLSLKETVWAAKQVVLDKLNQDLPNNLLNYGLYLLPSVPGKLGKYMDDGRFLGDYVLHGHVPRVEMRYKRRDYSIQVSLKGKDISKANTKANHRKFVENVVQGNTKKIEKMLDTGIDPNFITDDGNTPLGLACGRNSNIQVIMPLLSNGAHIDFRGKDGLTPLHRAALGGNSAAIKILLSYGASPNYRDAKGLTPLYHTAIMGDDTACCESLLRYRAELGIKDHGGWTELHQVTKYGHLNHANLLIKYGADLHGQNNAGNTPLHVAASHGQPQLAMLLMRRGSDRTTLNFSSQLPAQVAILCGHHALSAEISNFQSDQVEPITDPPDYHPGARQFDRNLFDIERSRSEVGPALPPPDTIVDSLAQEWTDKDDVDSGMTGGFGLQTHHSIETADSESLSSYDRDSIHSTSTAGGTTGPNTPQTHHRRQLTFATQRERLYRAGPGRYVAIEDVDPQQSDDIPLRRGMEVEVVFIGKGGYWEGKAGGRLGWFPARAIQEVTEDNDSGVFSEYSMGRSAVPMASLPEHQLLPSPPAMTQHQHQPSSDWPPVRRDVEVGPVTRTPSAGRVNTHPASSNMHHQQSMPTEQHSVREVFMMCGAKGFGFAMRGVKATSAMKFNPTPQVPALQYIGSVENGGAADLAGLKTGDFLLEINYQSVVHSTHDDVVNIIRQGGASLQLKVVKPLLDPTTRTSVHLQQHVQIINTSDSPNPRDAKRQQEPSKRVEAQSSRHVPPLQRETVIDDVPIQRRKGQESPNIDRINQSGWDSSQDEAMHTPGTPSHVQKFSYLQHGTSLPAVHQPSPRQHDTHSPSHHNAETPPAIPPKLGRAVVEKPPLYKASTLPPQKDYPVLEDSAESSENEDESEFTKALKMGKANLANSPATRKRSSTMPLRSRNTIQQFSSKGRENSHGNTSTESPQKSYSSMKQPLAAAIMRKIDSIQMDGEQEKSTDDEDSFGKTPPMRPRSHSQSGRKEKVPAPKPKPQVHRANTVVDPTAALEDNASSRNHDARFEELSTQYRGSSTGKLNEGGSDGDSGQVDWKSMLRPVKKSESGRASTDVSGRSRGRSSSNTSIPSPRKAIPDAVLNNHTHYDMECDHLPPPLPVAIDNRLSIDFLNLPPPDDFVSVPGVKTGETNTDDIIRNDIIPPPSRHRRSRDSPSPPPPPPPDSSPPREPLNHSDLAGVRFPPRTKSTPQSSQDGGDFKVPSPIPSPMYPSSFDADEESGVILPPQQFVHSRDEHGKVGSTLPGFEIPTPPGEDVATREGGSKTQPDLDEAIRQLQLLSEDLTTAPAEQSKGTPPRGHRHDVTLKQRDMLAANSLEPKSVTVAESPVHTPSVRSRSSTSSSNVSSLARDPEAEKPEITKNETHMSTAAHHLKPMMEWEAEEVCLWLEEIGLGEYRTQFQENEILGEHLLELTKDELAELGIKKIGHKKRFFTKVKELNPST